MDDNEILAQINTLVDEEKRLRARLQQGELSAAEEHERLRKLDVALDQCWDLLRQRRARKDFGEDPDQAEVRPAGEVEGYLQ
ncbi:DUF2630 family protein [Spirillospora sp. NPDC127200]